MKTLHPNFRLWVYSDAREGVFGDGKARLLSEVRRQGSLRRASNIMGISYRKAWEDLSKAEKCLGVRLLIRRRGGRGGGGDTRLSSDGIRILEAYAKYRERVSMFVMKEFRNFLKDAS